MLAMKKSTIGGVSAVALLGAAGMFFGLGGRDLSPIERDVWKGATRVESIAAGWAANPTPTEGMVAGMRGVAAHLDSLADTVETSMIPPTIPGDGLDTQLDGKPLPTRPDVDINIPRSDRYGIVIDGGAHDFEGGTYDFAGRHFSGVSSSGLLMKRHTSVSKFFVFASGGDGMKFDGGEFAGSLSVTDAHVFGLGLMSDPNAAPPHADAFQGRGNLESALFKDCFMDIPTNAGDGTRSNACIILSSKQGPNGLVRFEDCILRGGNYSIMLGNKGTDNYAGDITFDRCAFIVEKDSPRYGFVSASSGSVTFQPTSKVYYYCKESDSQQHRDLYGAPHADPVCHLMTRTLSGTSGTETVPIPVADFDFPAWHQETFGRETAR